MWAIILLVALVSVLHAGLNICPRCGHEAREAAAECPHCGTAMPNAPAAADDDKEPKGTGHVFTDEGGLQCLGAEPVDEEIALGRTYLGRENDEVARLLFLNAAALDRLTDPADKSMRSAVILRLLDECRSRPGTIRSQCKACGGSGRLLIRRTGSRGEVTFTEVPGKSCSECGGKGSRVGRGTVSDCMYGRGAAMRDYAQLQRGRKMEPVGNAWVPHDVAAHLSVRQVATLRRAVASPCGDCLGFCRKDCSVCRGTGRIPCTNRGCVDGSVTERTKSKLNPERVRRCATCTGTGKVSCRKCLGKGSMLCDSCNGTGEREPCSKCGGDGLADCRRCRGTGRYRGEVCAACKGEALDLCSSCNGDGRKR